MTSAFLQGVRVLDLTSMIVGPACSMRLTSYGATVTKLEAAEGDLMRALGGPSPNGQLSGTYLHLNRGKRSIGINLKHPDARRVVDRLLAGSDVVVTNMRPEALQRLGLDGESVQAINPGIVHCTITGFGPGGPYRGMPAYDSVVQGVSGIAGLFAERDGTPHYVPLMMADHVVGEIAAGAILAALYRRGQQGHGARIEVPMFETMAAMVLQEHMGPMTFEPPIGEIGDRRILSKHNRPMQTADGWISVTANTDAQARGMLKAIDRHDLIEDPRFASAAARFKNVDEWFSVRTNVLRTRTTQAWLEILGSHDVPCMPCHSLQSLLGDPHLQAVGLIEDCHAAPDGSGIRNLRGTVLENDVPLQTDAMLDAGTVGRETTQVLRELGFGEDDIADLARSGAIVRN